MEIDEGEVEIRIGMERRRREADFGLVFQVAARRALDLVEPEVIGAERRPGAIVAAGVMERYIGLELARPGEDVGLIDPVFDDPSELGVPRAPAAALWLLGKSKSGGQPCAAGGCQGRFRNFFSGYCRLGRFGRQGGRGVAASFEGFLG